MCMRPSRSPDQGSNSLIYYFLIWNKRRINANVTAAQIQMHQVDFVFCRSSSDLMFVEGLPLVCMPVHVKCLQPAGFQTSHI